MSYLKFILFAVTLLFANVSFAAGISDFLGRYVGSAHVVSGDETQKRDMSFTIEETKEGFEITWVSIIHRADGRTKEKTYNIKFRETKRDSIFASQMAVNVFGKPVPLDPMKGDPFVWSRIVGNTFTVFSMLIDEDGGYEVQVYNRTLSEGGLDLIYERFRNGEQLKKVTAFLTKQ